MNQGPVALRPQWEWEAPPVSREEGAGLLATVCLLGSGHWTPCQEPWILTSGAGGAFKGLEMT